MFTGSNQRVPEYTAWTALCIGMGVKTYVELGVGSSWEQVKTGMRVVTVDLLPNGFPEIDHVQGNSHDIDTLQRVIALLSWPDCVFIDADHTYEGCRADFEMWYPVAKKLVGFHDIYLGEGCDRFWNEISQQYPSVEICGRDHESAIKWQGNPGVEGRLRAGGVGVIFK